MAHKNQNPTHFGISVDHADQTAERACRAGRRDSLRQDSSAFSVVPPVTTTLYRVTCGACMRTKTYKDALRARIVALEDKELALATWRVARVSDVMGDDNIGPVERVKELCKVLSSFPETP